MNLNKNKKIFVSIPSRDRPEKLDRIINHLKDQSTNTNNYDLHIIIDNDQKQLYEAILQKNMNKIYKISYLNHTPGSFNEIFKCQNKIFFESNNYFFWFLADDMHGVTKSWDTLILNLHKKFEDDFFLLYTQTSIWGRMKENYLNCYKGEDTDNRFIYKYHEMSPINTYKFVYFLNEIYYNKKYKHGREIFSSVIIYLLNKKYAINRFVECNISWESFENNHLTDNCLDAFFELSVKKYNDKEFIKIINKIYKYLIK